MKRWIVGVLCGLILVGLVAAGFLAVRNYRDRELEKAAERDDAALVAKLQREFPVGNTMADVHAALRARGLDAVYFDGQVMVQRGTQPSFLWYCGPYRRVVVFRFSSSSDGVLRLTNINRELRGLACL